MHALQEKLCSIVFIQARKGDVHHLPSSHIGIWLFLLIWDPSSRCPGNKSPSILGSTFGPRIFGNFHSDPNPRRTCWFGVTRVYGLLVSPGSFRVADVWDVTSGTNAPHLPRCTSHLAKKMDAWGSYMVCGGARLFGPYKDPGAETSKILESLFLGFVDPLDDNLSR